MRSEIVFTILAFVLMVSLATVSKAESMGTAFTYQGRLMEREQSADGLYDLEFRLFDGPADGNQTGGIVEVNDVDVIDGYFTIELDFGSDVFDGDARWLEVAVRPGALTDPNLYVTLPERQPVTACPYALHTRGIFVDKAKNVGIGTTTPKGKLHVDGGKAKLGFRGTDITIEAQDGGDAGGLGGDNGGHGGNIILLPGEGGEPRGFGSPGRPGNVGIGTAAPEAMLDVRGNIKVDQKIQAYDSGGLELATDEGTTRIFVADDGKVGIGTTSPSSRLNVAQDSSAWVEGIRLTYGGYEWDIVSGGEQLFIAPNQTIAHGIMIRNGKLGIGTGLPQQKLHVEGDARVSDDLYVLGTYYGSFPRPAYDSGWVSIAQNSTITLDHNLGGNVDNYLVNMRFKDLSYGKGINNKGIGCDVFVLSDNMLYYGAHWKELTTSSIKVRRDIDDYTIDQVQIRIWVHK